MAGRRGVRSLPPSTDPGGSHEHSYHRPDGRSGRRALRRPRLRRPRHRRHRRQPGARLAAGRLRPLAGRQGAGHRRLRRGLPRAHRPAGLHRLRGGPPRPAAPLRARADVAARGRTGGRPRVRGDQDRLGATHARRLLAAPHHRPSAGEGAHRDERLRLPAHVGGGRGPARRGGRERPAHGRAAALAGHRSRGHRPVAAGVARRGQRGAAVRLPARPAVVRGRRCRPRPHRPRARPGRGAAAGGALAPLHRGRPRGMRAASPALRCTPCHRSISTG
jgi:hypothetical protein